MRDIFDARLVALILSLGLDTFAVSTAVGLAPLPRAARARLVALFALAEGVMPAVGLLLGGAVGAALGRVGTHVEAYAAAALLIATGLYMGREALEGEEIETGRLAAAASRLGMPLLALALSVSLDELAVGVSFGLLRPPLVLTLAIIALQAALLSAAGLWLGARLGRAAALGAQRAQLAAALALVLLGCFVAVSGARS